MSVFTFVKTVRKTLFNTIAIGERDAFQLQVQQRQLGCIARVRRSVDGQLLKGDIRGRGIQEYSCLTGLTGFLEDRPRMGPKMRSSQEEGSEELD